MRLAGFDSAVLGVTLALLSPGGVGAQPVATSLEQLKGLGSTKVVTVADRAGDAFRGTIADVSESSLCLQIAGKIRCFEAGDVDSVRVRKEDSLIEGALIGAAVGTGLTSLMFLDNECRRDTSCYAAVTVYGGIGTAAGLLIDALLHGTLVVYSAPSGKEARLKLSPMGPKGVRLTIVF
jgi:hypothetical protein